MTFRIHVEEAGQCLAGSSPGKNGRSVVSIIWVPGSDTAPERLLSAGLHREITEWDVQTLEPIEILVLALGYRGTKGEAVDQWVGGKKPREIMFFFLIRREFPAMFPLKQSNDMVFSIPMRNESKLHADHGVTDWPCVGC